MKTTSIVKSSTNNIPVEVQLASDLKQLSKDIKLGQDQLQKTLDELESSSIAVNIERNFLGQVKRTSVEKNFENVYSNLRDYISKCGEAIQKSNENQGRTLELIKLLALVEKDLYSHIDDQVVSNNELKSIILDWFKKQGINDDEVKELLETSFQRAYTLRDRINNLRQEYREEISQCDQRILAFEQKHNSLDTEIDALIENTTTKLKDTLEEDIRLLTELYNEKYNALLLIAADKENILNDIFKEFVERANEEKVRHDSMLQKLDEVFSSVKELSNSFSVMYSNKENQFKQLSIQKSDDLSNLRDTSLQAINELANKRTEDIQTDLSNSHKEYLALAKSTFESKSMDIETLCSKVTNTIEDSISNIQNLFSKTTSDIEVKKQNVIESFENTQSHIESKVIETEDKFDKCTKFAKEEYDKLLREHQEQFEEEKHLLLSMFKKIIIYTVLGTAFLSGVISYVVSAIL